MKQTLDIVTAIENGLTRLEGVFSMMARLARGRDGSPLSGACEL